MKLAWMRVNLEMSVQCRTDAAQEQTTQKKFGEPDGDTERGIDYWQGRSCN